MKKSRNKYIKKSFRISTIALSAFLFIMYSCNQNKKQSAERPEVHEKNAEWSEESAKTQKAMLMKRKLTRKTKSAGSTSYANGKIEGTWKCRGPFNQPGAWEMVEHDDGTDNLYGVTCGHALSEGQVQYIFKGSLSGDDFELISGNFPNRYKDLWVFPFNNKKRILVGIENGEVAYSDDNGASWHYSTGLPGAMHSTIVNRQDNYIVYSADGRRIYKSTDGGATFSLFTSTW